MAAESMHIVFLGKFTMDNPFHLNGVCSIIAIFHRAFALIICLLEQNPTILGTWCLRADTLARNILVFSAENVMDAQS